MMSALILALVAAATPAAQCHKIHYREDGTVQESWISAEEATGIRNDRASAHAHSSGSGSRPASSTGAQAWR